MPGQHDDGGAERDAAGASGIIAQQLGRRRRHRVAGKVMLEREQRIEPERLGQIAERQMLAYHRGIGAAGLAQHVERDTDFHDDPPMGLRGTIRRT